MRSRGRVETERGRERERGRSHEVKLLRGHGQGKEPEFLNESFPKPNSFFRAMRKSEQGNVC